MERLSGAFARGLAGCALMLIGIGDRGPLHLHGAQQPSFRASTEVRRVVVGVNDAGGAHVSGLGVDDFVITFGGRPGAVLEVEEVRFDDGRLASETGHSPDVFSNRAGDTHRILTLLIDDLHFQERTDAVRELARRFVRELAPDAPMGLVFTSGEGGVEPTTDRVELEQALDAFRDRFDPEGRRLKSRSIAPRLPNARSSSAPRDLAKFFADMTSYKVMRDVAAALARERGVRRTIVWISGGGLGNPRMEGAGAAAHYRQSFEAAVASLRSSGALVHVVHTGDADAVALRLLAAETGGVFMPVEQVASRFSELRGSIAGHYIVSVRWPVDSREARAWAIRTASASHRLTVSATGETRDPSDSTKEMLEGLVPRGPIGLRAGAFVTGSAASGRADVALLVELARDEAPVLAAELLRGQMSYEVRVVDLDRKKVVSETGKRVEAKHSSPDTAGTRPAAIPYLVHFPLALRAGRFQVRVVARHSPSGLVGSVYVRKDVPVWKDAPVADSVLVDLVSPTSVVGRERDSVPEGVTLLRLFEETADLAYACLAPAAAAARLAPVTVAVTGAERRELEGVRLAHGGRAFLVPPSLGTGVYTIASVAPTSAASACPPITFSVRRPR